jgi:hypothetical protein
MGVVDRTRNNPHRYNSRPLDKPVRLQARLERKLSGPSAESKATFECLELEFDDFDRFGGGGFEGGFFRSAFRFGC